MDAPAVSSAKKPASSVPPAHDKLKYRPDIDGLRALAVLLVILFHLNWSQTPGGYIGVDVFFVISGFLISRIILSDLAAGTFSFKTFYIRRTRRLLPALFATLLVSWLFAFLLFNPVHFANFAQSMMAAVFSVSNIYFWRDTGYFDLSAEFKPLLHTWSLGIEEQFYLIYPLFLVGAWKLAKRSAALAAIILITATLSLLANFAFQDGHVALLSAVQPIGTWLKDGPSTIFFLLPFRVFEFAIGAMVIWTPRPKNASVEAALLLIGLAAILLSAALYTQTVVFPSWAALVPCLGTYLALLCGQSRALQPLIANPVSAFLGRISYSLYLVHWPLIVFYQYTLFRRISALESACLFAVTLALGYALYRLVEVPFRSGRFHTSRLVRPLGLVATSLVLFAIASVVVMQDGWPWRLPPTARMIAVHASADKMKEIVGSIGCAPLCEFGNLNNPKIVIVAGDSHSDQYTHALADLAPDVRFKLLQSGSCFIGNHLRSRPRGDTTETCLQAAAEMKRWLTNPNVVGVIHAQRWQGYQDILETSSGTPVNFASLPELYRAQLDDIFSLYQGFPGKVVVVNGAPDTNLTCLTRPRQSSYDCPVPSREDGVLFADMFRAATSDKGERFALVDPADTLCAGATCSAATPDHKALYTDENHLSRVGARLIVPQMLDQLPPEARAKDFRS